MGFSVCFVLVRIWSQLKGSHAASFKKKFELRSPRPWCVPAVANGDKCDSASVPSWDVLMISLRREGRMITQVAKFPLVLTLYGRGLASAGKKRSVNFFEMVTIIDLIGT